MPVERLKPAEWSLDIAPEELGLQVVTNLRNMHFKKQRLLQVPGYGDVFGTPSAAPRYLVPNQAAGTAYWIYAADSAVYVTDGVSHFDITWAAMTNHATLKSPFSGGVINQLPFLNSAQDGPYSWDQNTANAMVSLPGWPGTDLANVMRPFREFLIAMNIFTGGSRVGDLVRWSDAAAPGALPSNWTASPTSQAGERSVSFNSGEIVDGLQLIDRFYIYKGTSTYLLQLIGGTFVFQQRPVFSTVGLLAKDCVQEWRGTHILLTDGDLIRHDGVNVNSLIQDKLRDQIFLEMDTENFENSYTALDTAEGILYVCRPRIGETYPSEAILISLQDGSLLGQRDLPAQTPDLRQGIVNQAAGAPGTTWATKATTWATDPTRWSTGSVSRTADFMVMADYGSTLIQQIGDENDQDGATLTATIERIHIDFGAPELIKDVQRIRPRVNGETGTVVQVQLGYADDPNDPVMWVAAQPFVIGTDRELTFDGVSGRYISYRFTSDSALQWGLPDMQIEYEPVAEY